MLAVLAALGVFGLLGLGWWLGSRRPAAPPDDPHAGYLDYVRREGSK